MKNIIVSLSVLSAVVISCNSNTSKPVEINKDSVNTSVDTLKNSSPRKLTSKTGMIYIIEEMHPDGASLSKVDITTQNFKENPAIQLGEIDPIKRVVLNDLTKSGFEQLFIFTASAGSGAQGNFYVYASDKDQRLVKVENAIENKKDNLKGGLLEGYMGHDSYSFEDGMLVRTFPIYKDTDTNAAPTGGTKKIFYTIKNSKIVLVKSNIIKGK